MVERPKRKWTSAIPQICTMTCLFVRYVEHGAWDGTQNLGLVGLESSKQGLEIWFLGSEMLEVRFGKGYRIRNIRKGVVVCL